jgi:hypothetical protein
MSGRRRRWPLLLPLLLALLVLVLGAARGSMMVARLSFQQQHRFPFLGGPRRVLRRQPALPPPPLPAAPFGWAGAAAPGRVRGVVLQAIDAGGWVVVKETGLRARVVSKQSNGARTLL